MKDNTLPFRMKNDLTITKNYRGIILTVIAVKVYNALLLSRIWPEIEKTLRKNEKLIHNLTDSDSLLNYQRSMCKKNLRQHYCS